MFHELVAFLLQGDFHLVVIRISQTLSNLLLRSHMELGQESLHKYTLPKNDIPGYYIDQYKTSYLYDEFLGIQNAAMALTSWDQINEDRGFQECKIHSPSIKGFRITDCQIWCISLIFSKNQIFLLYCIYSYENSAIYEHC